MIKCEVLVDRISLTIGKGSIVNVDDRQFEVAKAYLKPVSIEKPVKAEEVETREDKKEVLEKEVKVKKTKKK